MAELELMIAKRPLTVSVDDGDEARIQGLAEELSRFVLDLRLQSRDAPDNQILMLAALSLMSDRDKARVEATEMRRQYDHKVNDALLADQKLVSDDARVAALIDQLTIIVNDLAVSAPETVASTMPSVSSE